MHYHIILTERCNLRCSYCYEKSMQEFENGLEEKWNYDMETPVDSEVSIERLKKLVKSSDTLIFYGGEPLVMMDRMKDIMDNLNCRFMIQANGVLLNQLPTEYLLRLDKMLVSIDGTAERTNKNKGAQKYETVIKNLRDVRARGFKGEIVARMVITEPDLFEQVMHVVELVKEGLYDSIHWQIDAEFYKSDYDRSKFSEFVTSYNSSLDKLLYWWMAEMRSISGPTVSHQPLAAKKKMSKIWKIYPFLGVLGRVMGWDKETRLPCGAGFANFTINTKGNLSACPIMNSVRDMYCGSLEEGVTMEKNCGKWCIGCDYLDVCGGRCLYSNDAQLWPKEGHEMVCNTIQHLVDGIRRIAGVEPAASRQPLAAKKGKTVGELIDEGVVGRGDFDFEKYFGPEVIP